MFRPPLWGNFIAYADEDFLTFGLLAVNGLLSQAFYHGTQAIEKYLKALALSIVDPGGTFATPETENWIRTHNLGTLAKRCTSIDIFYSQTENLTVLQRFAEFDQFTRYPWVEQIHGNGFSGGDIEHFGRIILKVRNDLPIIRDDYSLGMEVRGHFHLSKKKHPAWDHYHHHAVVALRELFPNIDDFVRW